MRLLWAFNFPPIDGAVLQDNANIEEDYNDVSAILSTYPCHI